MITTDLTGKTALVTGSTSGIGKATAVMLGEAGAHVLVSGRDTERGEVVVKTITDAGGSAEFIAADLSSTDGARALAAAASADGRAVDILINNAGIFPFGSTAQVSDDTLDAVLTVNVKAPHVLVAALAPPMVARHHGVIVNVTTIGAQRGQAFAGLYGASKAALELLSKAWAAEFGPGGVRVNAVSPGPTHTEGTAPMAEMLDQHGSASPAGRTSEPADLAAAITFLATDAARQIHGVSLAVDGGLTAV